MVSNVKKISLHSTEEFMQGYNEDGDIGYILQVDVKPFLLKKMKVQNCEKLVCHLFEKKFFISIKALNQALDYGVMLEKST